MSDVLSEEELQELYAWIDEIPLTRQKKNIARDFSDGVLTAEVVHHFLPKMVELHNYSPANAVHQKVDNWRTLNRKVLSKLNFIVSEDLIQGVTNGQPGVIEFVLATLRNKIERYLEAKVAKNDYSNESLVHQDPLNDFPTDQMMSSFQNLSTWDEGKRHTVPAEYNSDLNITYPTGPATKPSRIPRKNTEPFHAGGQPDSGFLPPLFTGRHNHRPKPPPAPKLQRRKFPQYSHNEKIAPPINSRSRDNSAKYRLSLAEKDQRILESHEYIQFLQMKLTRYEHLVHIKDMKIQELKKELEAARNERRHTIALPYHHRR